MFRFKNTMSMMSWRHTAIYDALYKIELKIHKDDAFEATKCIKHSLGTSAEALDLLSYKTAPTTMSKISAVIIP